MVSRRRLLIAGALLSATGVYAYQRGLRYPRLSFEPRALNDRLTTPQAIFELQNLIELHSPNGLSQHQLSLRAIAPEANLTVHAQRGTLNFRVNNIAINAKLSIEGKGIKLVDEQIDGIDRKLKIESAVEQVLRLTWELPDEDGFDFAVMGDTGGGNELAWTLKRANELGAQFLLHLGDFNYSPGEYDDAISKFHNAPIPCYVTIGNHDFHDNGLIYESFLKQLGPMNHAFTIAGTQLVNIDTAADFFPAHAGLRGNLIKRLGEQAFDGERIFFTHRPLKDPRPHDDHEVGGINEIAWLANALKNVGGTKLLTGHVHHSAELDFEGVHQYTIGEGLGHENLILQRPVAKIMMARVEQEQPFSHSWVDLNMPWSEHTSPTHTVKLKKDRRLKQLEWYQTLFPQGSPRT